MKDAKNLGTVDLVDSDTDHGNISKIKERQKGEKSECQNIEDKIKHEVRYADLLSH